MTTKYFKSKDNIEVFKFEGRDLVKGALSINNTPNYLEINEEEYYSLMDRRTGRSTLLIDYYIQELFTCGIVAIFDHHETREAHRDLLHRVLKRLELEHYGAYKYIEVKGQVIKFKQEN